MPGQTGKDLYEHLEVLFNRVEDGFAEASFDFVLNELIAAAQTAAKYDGLVAHDVHTAARSFQQRYRKTDLGTPEIGFRGPAFDEPI